MDDAPAKNTDVVAGLSEVLRLTIALADRVIAELIAGRTIAKDQAEALATAVNGLREQGVTLPLSLEQRLQEISQTAKLVIDRDHRRAGAIVSWSFGRLRGARRDTYRKCPTATPLA